MISWSWVILPSALVVALLIAWLAEHPAVATAAGVAIAGFVCLQIILRLTSRKSSEESAGINRSTASLEPPGVKRPTVGAAAERREISVAPNIARSNGGADTANPPRAQDDRLLHWLSKVEGARGPVSRRAAVAAALREISDPSAKRALLAAASKIEVTAVLDKIETLKTPAAKRRHIEAALEALRNDELPDELQAEEIGALTEALASINGSTEANE